MVAVSANFCTSKLNDNIPVHLDEIIASDYIGFGGGKLSVTIVEDLSRAWDF